MLRSVSARPTCHSLFGEYLGHVLKSLEFQRIAARIQKEHGGLLPDLTLETDMRLNDKFRPGPGQLVRQRLPVGHRQYHPEVAHWNMIPVHRTGAAMADFAWRKMRDDLVPVEIEIDPFRGRSTLRASQQFAIKCPRLGKIIDGKSKMKKRLIHVHGISCKN